MLLSRPSYLACYQLPEMNTPNSLDSAPSVRADNDNLAS